MNREQTQAAIELMQAYVDGAEIEYKVCHNPEQWLRCRGDLMEPGWNWVNGEYRVALNLREFNIMLMGNGMIRDPSDKARGYQGDIVKVREIIE